MKVKTSSWHYKLNDTVWTHIEIDGHNLCRYFWMTVWSLTLSSMLVILIRLLLFLLFTAFAKGGLSWFFFKVCIVLFLISLYVVPKLSLACFRCVVGVNTEIPVPTILSEYIKAKKNKYCPMIEFE